MANRFWVGGTATWDATVGTKWATTSGGAGGAAVPLASDDVFFDAASGAVTITAAVTVDVCRSLNCSGFTGTFSIPAGVTVQIGDATAGASSVALLLSAGMTLTLGSPTTSQITFRSTSATVQTITSNGKTMPTFTINGAGSSYQLADANTVAVTSTVALTSGTFNTNGQTCSWGFFASTAAVTRVLTLGASSITVTGAGNAWNFNGATNFTVNPGTSTITFTGVLGTIIGPTLTLNNVVMNASGNPVINVVSLTCANFTRNGTAVKTDGMTLVGSLVVTSSLTLSGQSTTNRLIVQSNTMGATRTITSAVGPSISNVDFQDIAGAGAAAPLTGTSLGDALGNSGITFDTPATQTWQGTTGGNWSTAAKWTSRVPLPQDNVMINNAFSASQTVVGDMPRLGKDIDWTGVTGSPTWGSVAANSAIYGSLTLATGMAQWTIGAAGPSMQGRSSHTLTFAGKVGQVVFNINSFGGTYAMQDDLVDLNTAFNLILGTLDANGHNVTASSSNTALLSCAGAGICMLKMGSGTWTFASTSTTNAFWNVANPNMTVVPGTSTIVVSAAAGAARTFIGGGKTYNNLTYNVAGSVSPLVITGANVFNTLTVGSGRVVTFPAGVANDVSNWVVAGQNNGYQRLMGVASNFISTPDSAALSITGDLDIRVRVAMDDWTPAAISLLLCKFDSATTRSYQLFLNTGGNLSLTISSDGVAQSVVAATVATGITDGTLSWVRVTRRQSDGLTQFFKASGAIANPVTADWTQLGSNLTLSAGVAIFDSTSIVEIGSSTIGTGFLASGNFYRAQIRNNVLDNGTGIQLDADFTTKTFGANSFTESSTNAATVTITGATAQAGDGRVLINSSTPGTAAVLVDPFTGGAGNVFKVFGSNALVFNSDNVALPGVANNYITCDDSVALSITGDIDMRVKVALTDWTPVGTQYLITKANPVAGGFTFTLATLSAGTLSLVLSSDGTAITTSTSTASVSAADGTAIWVRATWRASDGRIQFFTASAAVTNPVTADWTQLGTNRTAAVGALFDSAGGVELGSRGGGASAAAGSYYRGQIRNNVLDDGTGIVMDFDASQRGTPNTSSFLTLQDSSVGGSAVWNAGLTSVSVSNVTNWTFTSGGSTGTAADTVTLSDAASRLLSTGRFGTDAVTLSDVSVRLLVTTRLAADSTSFTDLATRAVSLGRTSPDAFSVSDSASRAALVLLRIAADATSISDAASRLSARSRSAADSWAVSEAAARLVALARNGADTVSASDLATRVTLLLRVAAETVGVSDVASRALQLALRTAADAVVVSDLVTRLTARVRSAPDSWAISDLASTVPATFRSAADSVTLTDAVTRLLAVTRSGLESVLLPGDTAVRTGSHPRSAADTWSLLDAASGRSVLLRTASDLVVLSDLVTGRIGQVRFTADAFTVADLASRQAQLSGLGSDAWTVTETGSAAPVLLSRTAFDTFTILDAGHAMSGRLVASDSWMVLDLATGVVTAFAFSVPRAALMIGPAIPVGFDIEPAIRTVLNVTA